MVKIRPLVLLVCTSGLAFVAEGQTVLHLAYALDHVTSNGLVTAQFRSTGASSGDSILLTISKTPKASADPLPIFDLAGMRLTNVNGTGQSMVIAGVRAVMWGNLYVPVSEITLTDYETHTYLLAAFCAEFNKDNPSPNSIFSIGNVDPTLSCILNESRTQGLSLQATQAAVWIYTDRITFETVQHKFSVDSADWSVASPLAQRCIAANPQQQTFTPQQLYMHGSASSSPLPSAPATTTGTADFWTEKYGVGGGFLQISPGMVHYQHTASKKADFNEKHSWSSHCEEMSEWKQETGLAGNTVSHLMAPQWSNQWEFHIKTKNGKKYHLIVYGSEDAMTKILNSISRACGGSGR